MTTLIHSKISPITTLIHIHILIAEQLANEGFEESYPYQLIFLYRAHKLNQINMLNNFQFFSQTIAPLGNGSRQDIKHL